MAIGWLTVLKLVPWQDVIRNAPQVADGAKKLWSTLAKKPPTPVRNIKSQPEPSPSAPSLAQLQTQLDSVVAEMADLHQQMLASSELIQALADQNAQLIKRIEINRKRVLALSGVIVVLVISALIYLANMLPA